MLEKNLQTIEVIEIEYQMQKCWIYRQFYKGRAESHRNLHLAFLSEQDEARADNELNRLVEFYKNMGGDQDQKIEWVERSKTLTDPVKKYLKAIS
jgi:hypothetical protein